MHMRVSTVILSGGLGVGAASGAIITPADSLVEVTPGSQVSVLWLLHDASTPLFGYSLELLPAVSTVDTLGSVSIDVAQSNFFPDKNLIVAGGADLHPFFSVIRPSGPSGVFLNANTADLSTVVAVDGLNDVLAEIVFTATPDALGDFVFHLGPATALSDADGFAVPFDGESITIRVIPSTGGGVTLLGAALVAVRRRRS